MRLPIQPKTVKPKVTTIANTVQSRFMFASSMFYGTLGWAPSSPSPPAPARIACAFRSTEKPRSWLTDLCLGHFSINPFADICWAIYELDAFRFATRQKTHHVAIHQFYLFQIQNYATITRFPFQQFFQLSQACRLNSPAQSKDHGSAFRRSLNLKHRFVYSAYAKQCKRSTNRKRLKKLESVGNKMPTFRKLPKSWKEFL